MENKKNYYLTTPLYYVNARPHIGHAYTTVAADALARFHRLLGEEVFFLTGTDEHGQKVEEAAKKANQTPQEFTDELSNSFKDLWQTLNISYDDFIRTTEKRHKEAVKHVWLTLYDKGLIEKKTYDGWYCTPCEAFWTSRDLGHGEDASTICPECSRDLEHIQEENYFFKISQFQKDLLASINELKNSDRSDKTLLVNPVFRKNETTSFLEKNELLDLCVSRPKNRLNWGIECPLPGDHVTYVWFDALINYISALGYPDIDSDRFKKFWPCDIHLIGKDILRPHTVYWPIMLMGLGIAVPKLVFAHGWWMQDKAKMSKSVGNVVNPYDVVKEYGVDTFRYFLLSEIQFGTDGNYSDEAITRRYNVDLANDLGNLLHRTLSMIEKYFDGTIKALGAENSDCPMRQFVENHETDFQSQLRCFMNADQNEEHGKTQFSSALALIFQVVGSANNYIEQSAPWTLAKEGRKDELCNVMVSLAETLRIVLQLMWPFIPESAEKMWHQLGIDEKIDSFNPFAKTWNYFDRDIKVRKGEPAFPRRDAKKKV